MQHEINFMKQTENMKT